MGQETEVVRKRLNWASCLRAAIAARETIAFGYDRNCCVRTTADIIAAYTTGPDLAAAYRSQYHTEEGACRVIAAHPRGLPGILSDTFARHGLRSIGVSQIEEGDVAYLEIGDIGTVCVCDQDKKLVVMRGHGLRRVPARHAKLAWRIL